MPRLARPGNRETIEAALLETQRAVLADLCRQLGIDPAGWHRLPAFRVFLMGAVTNLAGELELGGANRENALLTACIRLGVSAESARTWRRRARLASRVSVQDEPPAAVSPAA